MRNIVRVIAPTMLLILSLAWGTPVYGHERWFVDHGGLHVGESQWIDWLNILLIAVGLFLIVAVVLIDRSRWYGTLERLFEKWQKVLPRGMDWRLLIYNFRDSLLMLPTTLTCKSPGLSLPAILRYI